MESLNIPKGKYLCALCKGEGKAKYHEVFTGKEGIDTCPDCEGKGYTDTDNTTIWTKIATSKEKLN